MSILAKSTLSILAYGPPRISGAPRVRRTAQYVVLPAAPTATLDKSLLLLLVARMRRP